MRNLLLASTIVPFLAGCSIFQAAQTGQPVNQAQLQSELATAAAILKEAGCFVSVAGAAASPIVAVTADDQGNKTLAAISATGSAICSVPAPATVASPPGTTLGAVVAAQ